MHIKKIIYILHVKISKPDSVPTVHFRASQATLLDAS